MLQHHSFKNKLDKNEDNNNIILNKQKKGKIKTTTLDLEKHNNITRRNEEFW